MDWKSGLASALSLRGRGNRIENHLARHSPPWLDAGRPSQEQHSRGSPACGLSACLLSSFLSAPLSRLPFPSSLSPFHLIFLLSPLLLSHSLLCPFLSSFCFCFCVSVSHSWKQSFAKKHSGFDFEPLFPSRPSTPFFSGPGHPPGLPPPPQAPGPPPHSSLLRPPLSPDRWEGGSTASLKQHLIAVFCSWTSKLGLRHCAGVAAAQAVGERRCVNRPRLNGLCVAARACLLYMLFDPDMISWRERGPGWASLRMLGGPAPSSLPRSPGPAALCPSPQPWAASSPTGLARRALCWGQRRGQAAGGGPHSS